MEMRLKDLQRQLGQARDVQGVGQVPEFPGTNHPMAPKAKPSSALDRLVPGPHAFKEAGGKAGSEFASALTDEAEKAGAIADQLKARFSFTATPTINPSFSGAAPISAPGRGVGRSAGQAPAGPLNIKQTINQARDPHRAAREAQRLQNRAIRAARARALHDTGDFA